MRVKQTVGTIIAIIITISAAAVFGVTAMRSLWHVPDGADVSPPMTRDTRLRELPFAERPKKLTIPALNIDADVQHVGRTAKGNMAVPNNYQDVGWFQFGTVPGERGSAVIAGHVDNGLKLPGVFKRLDAIQIGNEILVETDDGRVIPFVVSDIQSYPYTDVPVELIFNRSDGARLNLITCQGGWVASERTYDQRLVVFAILKS